MLHMYIHRDSVHSKSPDNRIYAVYLYNRNYNVHKVKHLYYPISIPTRSACQNLHQMPTFWVLQGTVLHVAPWVRIEEFWKEFY